MQGLAALLGSHSPLSTKVSVILCGDLISHIMDSWRQKKRKKRIETGVEKEGKASLEVLIRISIHGHG